jgi:hypothetical protein
MERAMPEPCLPKNPSQEVSGADAFRQAMQQKSQEEILRRALKDAKVSDATANKIIAQQQQEQQTQQPTHYQIFNGYVGSVGTSSTGTDVWLYGQASATQDWRINFVFPPNDAKFISEFQRAQSHPHLWVGVRYTQEPGKVAMIYDIGVATDYPDARSPSFDTRQITNEVRIQGTVHNV